MSSLFKFKQFEIDHADCTMKVGTDGVLLGAYVKTEKSLKILDVGTGSGLIAIMLAQKSKAEITGLEIDHESAEKAKLNGQKSPWKDRLSFVQTSFQEYYPEHPSEFDCVVCNPPFFSASLKSPDALRNLARHDIELNSEELITGTKTVLISSGTAWFILPFASTDVFIQKSCHKELYVKTRTDIFPKTGKKAHRSIVSLTPKKTSKIITGSLAIRDSNGNFTEEYRKLTSDFYLFF
jgi:tRNA1Val (adenine37-N6)-methyltransferase